MNNKRTGKDRRKQQIPVAVCRRKGERRALVSTLELEALNDFPASGIHVISSWSQINWFQIFCNAVPYIMFIVGFFAGKAS